MAVWSGWGWLGYAIMAGLAVAKAQLLNAVAGPELLRDNTWLFIVPWILTSTMCWFLGRWLNRDRPIRFFGFHSLRDKGFDGHTLFFVRLEFAGVVATPIYVALILAGSKLVS